MKPKKSLALPIVVGIVLPIVLILFGLLAFGLTSFVLGGLSSTDSSVSSGISLPAIIFIAIGGVWLVAGIVWTLKAKRG